MSDSDLEQVPDDAPSEEPAESEASEKWPFGFILTIVMVSVYLAYRLIQGVVLFFDWIF